jgi:hypothetical protein
MSNFSTVVLPGPLSSVDSATFSGSYVALGSALAHPARIIKLTNNSTVDVTVSWDGVTDNEFLPSGSFLLLDVTTNHSMPLNFEIQQGTAFFVKGNAGTGSVYMSYYYGK